MQSCISEKNLCVGRELHRLIVQQGFEANTFLGSHLIRLFSVCGRLLEASLVFNKLLDPNIFAWTELILAHANYGNDYIAIRAFEDMICASTAPDSHTIVAVLTACARKQALPKGQLFHFLVVVYAFNNDIYVNNAIMNMYVKCEALGDAHVVFKQCSIRDVYSWCIIIAGHCQHMRCQEAVEILNAMQKQDIEANNVAWNAIIHGYAQDGNSSEALDLFVRMLQHKREPDNFTFVSVLKACSSLVAIEKGRLIHTVVTESSYGSDVYVRSILIDMYAKSGSLDDACRVFHGHKVQNVITWTAMMAAYALHSNYSMVVHCFKGMEGQGLTPSSVTFLCLLSTCSHLGLVDNALRHLNAMKEQYGIIPNLEHYNCLIDLLGRAGLFSEAAEILECMKGGLNYVAMTSLLNSCRICSNVDLSRDCLGSRF